VQGPATITEGVFGLGSQHVNWYLIEEQGRLTAVDAGLPGFAGGLEAQLASIGHEITDVEAVLLTHSDADHTGLAPLFTDVGARAYVHGDDEPTLARPRPKTGDASPIHIVPELWRPRLWSFFGHMMRNGGARPHSIPGAETFADGDLLDVPGSPSVIHTPGHTPGHCALLFAAHRALFVGDELCTRDPFTGRTGPRVMPSAVNVDTRECVRSLARIEDLEADVVLVGHGEPWRGSPRDAVAAARREVA
jgi:glyoxylase-like metal-dependent hydrolase (beta-lactamase superfamily II)